MKRDFFVKILIVGLFVLTAFGCQSQPVSNSSNTIISNVSANNRNTANQPNAETSLSAPQRVTFESADKVEIVGTFYQSAKENSPAVVLLHQWESNRQAYDEFAKRLQKQGFGVLAIDGRGFGESVKTTDGVKISASRTDEAVKGMKDDTSAAFDFLAKQKNVAAARIGIVGASYGSSLAIIYGAENPKVKAVALLSPGLDYFGNMPTMPAVKNYGNRPLLLVAAEDDAESADAVRQLKQSVANDKYEVKIYQKGGHGTGIFKAKVGLEDLLEAFLVKNL